MANDISNVVHAMATFGFYLDAESNPQLIVPNQVGISSARLLTDDDDVVQGVIFVLDQPCVFNALPTMLPILTTPIPGSQVIVTGYNSPMTPEAAFPAGAIVPNDVPLNPSLGFRPGDGGAIVVGWYLDGSAVAPPLEVAGYWQLTVLDFPSTDTGKQHGIVLPGA